MGAKGDYANFWIESRVCVIDRGCPISLSGRWVGWMEF